MRRTLARWSRAVPAVLSAALLTTACLDDRTLPAAPAAGGSGGPSSVRLSLGAQVLTTAASQVDVRLYYLRTGGSTVDLLQRRLVLDGGTQSVELTLDPARCLADAQRLRGSTADNRCVIGGVLTLGGVTLVPLDSTAILPFEVGPGDTRVIGDELTLGGEWKQLSVGAVSSCGVRRDWAVYCWGNNDIGQLGTGGIGNARTPVRIATGVRFARVSVGALSACALTALGQAYCWGLDEFGGLGRGALAADRCVTTALGLDDNFDGGACSRTPQPVVGEQRYRTIAVGAVHSCALDVGGRAYCWGARPLLGIGGTERTAVPTPTAVSGDRRYASLEAGVLHTCAVTDAGQGWCWGSNERGELGAGAAFTGAVGVSPLPVVGGLTFRSISAGWASTCGVTTADQTYCWGDNRYLQHGVDARTRDDTDRHPEPRRVALAQAVGSVTSGWRATCAVGRTGAASCWGSHERGALGIGAAVPQRCTLRTDAPLTFACSPVPSTVAGGLTFAAVQAGSESACGITRLGALHCWGDDAYGQLGAGRPATTPSSPVPVPVSTPVSTPAASLAADVAPLRSSSLR